jgi:hypothetical protein
LSAKQRILELYGARVGFQLVLSLWAKVDPTVPGTVGTIAEQKQPATVQADHSSSP